MATKILSATIDEKLAEKLSKLAAETNRKKSYFVNQALKEYLEEIEDYEIALKRKDGEPIDLEQVKKELNL
jgi:RHH-type transcriptional regulator, rel operon repressor / antitoxin RelB